MPEFKYMKAPEFNRSESLDFSNTLWSFLTNNSNYHLAMLWKHFETASPYTRSEMLNLGEDGMLGNFFHLRKGGEPLISYLPAGKEHQESETGVWLRAGRQAVRPGKWLREVINPSTLINYNMGARDIEAFANAVKSFVEEEVVFKELRGKDIRRYYHENMHGPGDGSLASSCMRYEACQKFFTIYEKSPHCSLLVALKDGLVMARALLWRDVEALRYTSSGSEEVVEQSINLMDRIYVTQDHYLDTMKEWAVTNGFYHKAHQTFDEKWAIVSPSSEVHEYRLTVKTGYRAKPRFFPYVDTFAYMAKDWKTISNTMEEDHPYTMHSQDGGIRGYVSSGMFDSDFEGVIPRSQVVRCIQCRRTGLNESFHHPDHGIAVCNDCVTINYVFSSVEDRWLHRANPDLQNIKVWSWGLADGVCTSQTETVYSQRYLAFIAKRQGFYLADRDDWVLERDLDLRYCEYDRNRYLTEDMVNVIGFGLVYKGNKENAAAIVEERLKKEVESRAQELRDDSEYVPTSQYIWQRQSVPVRAQVPSPTLDFSFAHITWAEEESEIMTELVRQAREEYERDLRMRNDEDLEF